MFHSSRNSKKKRLTDPVAIIPFKGQSDNKQKKIEKEKPIKKTDTPSISDVKIATKLASPTRKLHSNILGIKDLMNKKAEDSSVDIESGQVGHDNTETNPFTLDEMRMKWIQYAYQIKETIPTLATAMKTSDPQLKNGRVITFEVENKVQFEFLEANKTNILSYLRKSLQNYKIDLIFAEKIEETKGLYSSKEKYQDMVKRNPELEILRKKFNMDIEL